MSGDTHYYMWNDIVEDGEGRYAFLCSRCGGLFVGIYLSRMYFHNVLDREEEVLVKRVVLKVRPPENINLFLKDIK
jgi:hypothetical protein